MSSLGIHGFPTIKFMKADGSVFGEIGGYEPTDAFIADMNKALDELKLSIPAVYAAPFVYDMLADMAIPANWLLTPAKTELLGIGTASLPEWQAKMAETLEKASAR